MSAAVVDGLNIAPARGARSPRLAIIVLLQADHAMQLHTEDVERLFATYSHADVKVVACIGEPSNLDDLKRAMGDAEFMLVPSGTTPEDLRELAMSCTPGDIVTLLSGEHAFEASADTRPATRSIR